MKGLMLAIGAKDKPEKGDNPAREYAREAYTALKDGDEDGFIEAILALKSCGAKKAEPEDDEEEEADEE